VSTVIWPKPPSGLQKQQLDIFFAPNFFAQFLFDVLHRSIIAPLKTAPTNKAAQ
jgi:hypothetical protein